MKISPCVRAELDFDNATKHLAEAEQKLLELAGQEPVGEYERRLPWQDAISVAMADRDNARAAYKAAKDALAKCKAENGL